MRRNFVKYLLLSIILLSGYSHLSGAVINVSDISNVENIKDVTYLKNESDIVKSSLSHFEKINFEIEISESEDDETSSLKKYVKASPYFATSTANPQSDFIIDHIQQASFIKKFSHLISCKRYILLRVFRI